MESSEEAGAGKSGGDAFLVSHAIKDRAVADLAAVEQVDLTRDEGKWLAKLPLPAGGPRAVMLSVL